MPLSVPTSTTILLVSQPNIVKTKSLKTLLFTEQFYMVDGHTLSKLHHCPTALVPRR